MRVGPANLASSTPWQPRGVLVAHLAEHKRAVNRIAVAPNGAFFVTASNDETCKIWDSRRLEKDISFRSKLTYASQACPDSLILAKLHRRPGQGMNKGVEHSCLALAAPVACASCGTACKRW